MTIIAIATTVVAVLILALIVNSIHADTLAAEMHAEAERIAGMFDEPGDFDGEAAPAPSVKRDPGTEMVTVLAEIDPAEPATTVLQDLGLPAFEMGRPPEDVLERIIAGLRPVPAELVLADAQRHAVHEARRGGVYQPRHADNGPVTQQFDKIMTEAWVAA